MPINVDTTNETVELELVDDKDDALPMPAGASVTFSASDPSVVTINVDPNNPLKGDIVPEKAGTVDLSSVGSGITDANGNALPDPAPVSLQVDPGAPAGERLVLSPNQ